MFLPHLMTSQPCESTFRSIRSISSTYSTQVNASMLEILHRLKRIQYQGDITCSENMKEIHFPNLNNRSEVKKVACSQVSQPKLPQNGEMIHAINQAREDSVKELFSIGICLEGEESQLQCMVWFKNIICEESQETDVEDIDDYDDEECFEAGEYILSYHNTISFTITFLKKYSELKNV